MNTSLTAANHLFFFWQKVKEVWRGGNSGLRYGQATFNVLSEVRPELAEKIRGTDNDPSYQDRYSPQMNKFISWLDENFYKNAAGLFVADREQLASETKRIEEIAKEFNIDESVANDIDYLRCLEKRIIAAAKKYPDMRDFSVYNAELERQLEMLEEN